MKTFDANRPRPPFPVPRPPSSPPSPFPLGGHRFFIQFVERIEILGMVEHVMLKLFIEWKGNGKFVNNRVVSLVRRSLFSKSGVAQTSLEKEIYLSVHHRSCVNTRDLCVMEQGLLLCLRDHELSRKVMSQGNVGLLLVNTLEVGC